MHVWLILMMTSVSDNGFDLRGPSGRIPAISAGVFIFQERSEQLHLNNSAVCFTNPMKDNSKEGTSIVSNVAPFHFSNESQSCPEKWLAPGNLFSYRLR